jgi:hypothetical protein
VKREERKMRENRKKKRIKNWDSGIEERIGIRKKRTETR